MFYPAYKIQYHATLLKLTVDDIRYDIMYRKAIRRARRAEKRRQKEAEKINEQQTNQQVKREDKKEIIVAHPDEVIDKDGTVIHIAIGNDEDPNNPFMKDQEFLTTLSRVGDRMEPKGVHRNVAAAAAMTVLGLIDAISLNQILKTIKTYKNEVECRIVINAISNYYSGTKIFGDQNVYDVQEVIPVSALVDIVTYLYQLRKWSTNHATMSYIIDKTNDISKAEQYRSNQVHEGMAVRPIIFNNYKLSQPLTGDYPQIILPNVAKVSPRNISLLENMFGDVLKKYHHSFDVIRAQQDPNIIINGVCMLHVTSNRGISTAYTIDMNTLGANGYSLVGTFVDDTGLANPVFINIQRDRETIRKIFAMNMDLPDIGEEAAHQYHLEINEETGAMIKNQFKPHIYHMFDFTDMTKIISRLTDENHNLMEKVLQAVHDLPWGPMTYMRSRFRFNDYVSPTEFMLVSDSSVNDPLGWSVGRDMRYSQVIIDVKGLDKAGNPKIKIRADGEPLKL